MRKYFTTIAAACLLAGSAFGQAKRPNILLILADDLGFSDLGCYGGEIDTPNLDRLATGGLRMTQLYNASRCCSTRASLLTGLYAHQAGVGAMSADNGKPGYRGFLTKRCVTIATLLKNAGYQTFMSGKWHLKGVGNPDCTPVNRGFDEFYGHYRAYASFYRPDLFIRLPEGRPQPPNKSEDFYATDAITDYALTFVDQARGSENPWFLYLAYNAPHFPLHAPKDIIDKYVDRYEAGWDSLRQTRYERMLELGIIKSDFKLSPRGHVTKVPQRNKNSEYYDKQIPAWDSLPDDRRHDLARRMATYAAMVEIMDRNIGRVVKDLDEHDELQNTLIVFLSDNGACAEWDPYGFDNNPYPVNKLYRGADLDQMGQKQTFHSYGTGWANACNTPFRMYKHYNHEGGISAPLIVHWPERVKQAGAIDHQPAHVIDVSATLLDVGGGKYPRRWRGNKILPLAGVSLLPAWQNDDRLPERPLFFEHEGNRAIRSGKWKAVWTNFIKEWELYDMDRDRSELANLVSRYPEKVTELDKQWRDWAARCFVESEQVKQPAKGMPKIYYWETGQRTKPKPCR
jgi:arylsulfatase A-like enzyme